MGVWDDIARLSGSLFAVLEGKERRHERLKDGGRGSEGVGKKTYESRANHADEGGVVVVVVVEVFGDVFRPPCREETHWSMLQGVGVGEQERRPSLRCARRRARVKESH